MDAVQKQPTTIDYVVTLVHGTKSPAKKYDYSEWGGLERAIATKLAPRDVFFRHFHWDGANSHRIRFLAGDGLRAALAEATKQAPNARQFIVAHSHGGNIALRAAAGLDEQVDGVICLSTPFLFVSSSVQSLFPDVGIGGWLALAPVAAYALHASFGLSIPLSAVLGVAVAFVSSALAALVWSNAHLMRDELQLPRADPERTLIIRHPRDEASVMLAWPQLQSIVANKVTKLVRIATAALTRFECQVRWGLVAGGSLALVCYGLERAGWRIPELQMAATALAALLLLPLVAAMLIGIVIVIVAALSFDFVGGQLALAVPFLQIGIEAAPGGNHKVTTLESTGAFLEHSSTYKDPSAFDIIADWVLTRPRPGSGDPPAR